MTGPGIRFVRERSTFVYTREDRTYEGRFGLVRIGAGEWPTVELVEKDGIRMVSLRAGEYQVEMGHMGTGRRALRFLAAGHTRETYGADGTFASLQKGRIYAHGANVAILRPDHLKGCFGAGVAVADLGVRASTLAMCQIFDLLGKFREGARFRVEIE